MAEPSPLAGARANAALSAPIGGGVAPDGRAEVLAGPHDAVPAPLAGAGYDADADSDSDSDADADADAGERVLWTTLEHNGVYFPPEYAPHRPLPRGARLVYAGAPVELPPAAEEIAYAYARVLDRPAAQAPGFRANFFADLNAALAAEGHAPLDAAQCDFAAMRAHFLRSGAAAPRRGTAASRAVQAAERFHWCRVDGEQCEVRDFRLDAPGLFFATAGVDARLSGRWVRRVRPDEIVLNLGAGAAVPPPPTGCWRGVVCDQTQLWLAAYEHPVLGPRRVRLAGQHRWHGTQHEHELAHELAAYVWRVRADYGKDLRSTLAPKREAATLLWLVDLLGLRVKATREHAYLWRDHELGLASLRCDGLALGGALGALGVEVRFAGPHALTFTKQFVAPPVVFANLQRLVAGRARDARVFSAGSVRAALHRLAQYRRGLSPTCFRAFALSRALQLAIDDYEARVIPKWVPCRQIDRIEVLHQLFRKVAAGLRLHAQLPADARADAQSPRIALYAWAAFRLKMKLRVLDPAFVVGETMGAAQYRELGRRYAREIDPRHRHALETDVELETAGGYVELAHNVTIPNDAAYVWDLICDKMLLIDIERLRRVDAKLDADLLYERLVDPRIVVAYAKRHGVTIPRVVRNTVRTRWAYTVPPDFHY